MFVINLACIRVVFAYLLVVSCSLSGVESVRVVGSGHGQSALPDHAATIGAMTAKLSL
jgi:hypothetical protein